MPPNLWRVVRLVVGSQTPPRLNKLVWFLQAFLLLFTLLSVLFGAFLKFRCFTCKPAVCDVKSESIIIAGVPPYSLYDTRLIRQTYT